MKERIQKLLSRQGLGSRRAIETKIRNGCISVNGKPAKIGMLVDKNDRILVNKVPAELKDVDDLIKVIAYNKAEGEICTAKDPKGRSTVFKNLPKLKYGRWIMIGRLDISTSGLLLFTTDGKFANKLMHPSSGIDREYLVRVNGQITKQRIGTLLKGVNLSDGFSKFSDIVLHPKDDPVKTNHWVYVTIMGGRNREVRRLWESQQLVVNRLKRVRFGCIFLPAKLQKSSFIHLDSKAIRDLKNLVNFS